MFLWTEELSSHFDVERLSLCTPTALPAARPGLSRSSRHASNRYSLEAER